MLSLYPLLLAFPVLVFSQFSTPSPSTSVLSTQAQATAFVQSAPVFNGSVVINTFDTDTINLNGLARIDGSLIISNATNIKTLVSDTLTSIRGSFTLQNLPALTNVSLPALSTLGSVTWQNLTLLSTALLAPEIPTIYDLSMVQTNLSSLPNITTPIMHGYISLQDNPSLKSVSLPSILSMDDGIYISNAYSHTLVSVSLPNLANTSTLSLTDISSLSIPALKSLSSQFFIYYSTITSVSAPSLTDLSLAYLSILDNPLLTAIEMPLVRTVRQIVVGTNVTTLYLPMLQRAQMIQITGPLTNLTFSPNLLISQSLTMDLSSSFDCNAFATAAGAPNVTQTFQCSSNANSYYHNASPSGLSTGAKAGIGVGVGVGVVVILLALEGWYLFWKRGKRERAARAEKEKMGSEETGEGRGGETRGGEVGTV